MPRPASPWNWTVTVRDDDTWHLAHLNTRRAQPLAATPEDHFVRRFSAPYQPMSTVSWERLPKYGDDPAAAAFARAAWDDPAFGFFRWFAQAPVLETVEARAAADGSPQRCAWFRDLRFGFPGRGDPPFRYALCRAGAEGAGPAVAVYTRDRDSGEVLRVASAEDAARH
jgi:inner membrane protein